MNRVHTKVLLLKEFGRMAIRGYFSADLVISLIGMAIFAFLIWYFDLFDNSRDNIRVFLVYTLIPLSIYKTVPSEGPWYRTLNYWNLCLTLSLLLAVSVMMGDNLNLPWLTFNAAMIFFAIPCLFILVSTFLKRPFLVFGIIPSAILTIGSLIHSLDMPLGVKIDFLLFPIPIVLPLCVVWALIAGKLLDCARAYRSCAVRGPFYELSTMTVLFVPLIILVLIITSENPIWMAVWATILGVLFSSVIATPLRNLLLELAELTKASGN